MKSRFLSPILSVLMFLCVATPASAMVGGDLKSIRIVGHHFATAVTSTKRRVSVKKPASSRYVVMKLSARFSTDDRKVFAPDFMLRYYHADGKEDRAVPSALCRAKTSQIGERDICSVSKYGWVKMTRGQTYIIVAFIVESDVEDVSLYIAGKTTPLRYNIGSDRPYSVYVSTSRSSSILPDVRDTITAGGYQVVRTSTGLNKTIKGIVINYTKGAETQAREISQRIMTKLGEVPKLKKMNLATDKDVVVWIGKSNNAATTTDSDDEF